MYLIIDEDELNLVQVNELEEEDYEARRFGWVAIVKAYPSSKGYKFMELQPDGEWCVVSKGV